MAELQRMQSALASSIESAQIRGEGRASFLFAQHQGRAVEVSENDDKWWVEFWESEENNAIAETTVNHADAAIAHAIHWLLRREGPGSSPNLHDQSIEQRVGEHEAAFVQAFIIRQRRERYESKLASRKHRRRFLNRLNHQFHKDLDPRFIVRGAQPWPMGGETCSVLADELEYDGKLVTPAEAADIVAAASFGIVVSFVPGKLACYKDESPANVLWLERE